MLDEPPDDERTDVAAAHAALWLRDGAVRSSALARGPLIDSRLAGLRAALDPDPAGEPVPVLPPTRSPSLMERVTSLLPSHGPSSTSRTAG